MRFALGVSLVVACSAMAQTTSPPKVASIEGTVVNSVTNEPIRKANLTLSGSEVSEAAMEAALAMFGGGAGGSGAKAPAKPAQRSFSATTDASGKFRFDGVDAGDFYLKATHAGFADMQYKPQGGKNAVQVHVAAGAAMTEIVIRMVPHGSISGRVVDEDGDPVTGVTVNALSSHNTGGRARLVPVDTAQVNAKGEFHLEKVPPGRYYLSANLNRMDFAAAMGAATQPAAAGVPETDYVTTYFPGVTEVSTSQKMEVAAGAEVPGMEIHLRKALVARVSGVALTSEGAPMKSGSVMLMNAASIGSMQMGMIHPDGEFELAGVQPGPYMLMTIEMKGVAPSIQMHSVVVPKEGLHDVKLASLPEGTVHGKVIVSGDGDVKTAGMMVMLSGQEDTPSMPAMAAVSDTGTFSVKVSAASYDVVFPTMPKGAYVKSVVLNGRETIGKPLDFSAAPSGDLVITFGTDGGGAEVVVSGPGEKPAADCTVVLLPADPARRLRDLVKTSETDATGQAAFHDLPPGDYVAFAWQEVDDGDWLDADFMKTYEQSGVAVSVKAKGTEKVALKLIPPR